MSQAESKAARFAFSIPTSSDDEQRQLFDEFGPCGFAGLQLKGGQYARYIEQPERFLQAWGNAGGATSGLIYGGGLDDEGIMALRGVLEFAAAIGTELVVFCHGRARATVTSDDIRHFAHWLSILGAEAAGRGVRLSLHHHYDQPVMYPDDFEVFFNAITPGTVGLTLDTAHLRKSGIFDIPGMVREFGAFIDNVHLKDFQDGQFKTLGRGEIEFDEVFAALHDIDFKGWLCADEESETSVGESLRASHAFITRGWQGTKDEA